MNPTELSQKLGVNQIRRILYNTWAPLGARDQHALEDECNECIPQIARLLLEGADVAEVAMALRRIEVQSIGLKATSSGLIRAAEDLVGLRG